MSTHDDSAKVSIFSLSLSSAFLIPIPTFLSPLLQAGVVSPRLVPFMDLFGEAVPKIDVAQKTTAPASVGLTRLMDVGRAVCIHLLEKK